MSVANPGKHDIRNRSTLAAYCVLSILLWSALVAVSLWTSLRHLEQSTLELASTQGREVFRLVEAMRVWNAEHGGIYVLQTERDPPNPYLSESMRATATITGKPLTLLNPAYMTRQISGVIEREAGIRLHLTSLKPLNPDNRASAWEARALHVFEQGEFKEQIEITQLEGQSEGRYIAPLFVKPACLSCHEKQGYKLGDVRGGLSVQWSVEPLVAAMHATRDQTLAMHLLVWLLIGALLMLAIRQLLGNLATIRESGQALANAVSDLEANVEARTKQLQESMQTLQSVSDLAPGVVYQYRMRPDGSTCIPYASERLHDLFGLRPAEVRDDASPIFARVHPGDVAGLIASTQVSARDLSRWHHEFRVRRPDGKELWVLCHTVPIREQDGSVLWNGFLTDITERKANDASLAQSEERLRLLFENILHGVLFQNERGEVIGANPMAEQILGISLDRMLGHTSLDPNWHAIHADGSAFPGDEHPAMQALQTGQAVCDVVMGVFNPKLKKIRWLLVSAVPQFRAGQSAPFEAFSTFSDITERKQSEEILKRHKIIVETAQDGFWMTDALGHIHEVNRAYAAMTGYSVDALLKMQMSDLEASEKSADVRGRIEKIMAQGHDQFETRHRHKDGHEIDMEVSATYMPESREFFVFCRDISGRKQAQQAMRDLAYFDVLTGLPNRRMLSDRLTQAMAASKRTGHFGALMFLDLDNFKTLNDRHGHEVGDELLIEVARRIKLCVREADTVARFGGDEFVVMLTELDAREIPAIEQARLVAEKIRLAVGESYYLSFGHQGTQSRAIEHRCSASIGVVTFADHEISEKDLLKWADKAMYEAKKAGRNQICCLEGGA